MRQADGGRQAPAISGRNIYRGEICGTWHNIRMLPPIFYKYAGADTALAVLSNQSLRWSSPELFNDVLEFRRFPRFVPDPVATIPSYLATLARAAAGEAEVDLARLNARSRKMLVSFGATLASGTTLEQLIARIEPVSGIAPFDLDDRLGEFFQISGARVLCLTETPLNQAMWGNYAENASGCVLGFRTLPESAWAQAKKVTYTDKLPAIGTGLDLHLYGLDRKMLSGTVQAVCFSKRAEWSYEKEWRVMIWENSPNVNNYNDFSFLPDELESVTLGSRATNGAESEIRNILKRLYPSCQLYRVTIKKGEAHRMSI